MYYVYIYIYIEREIYIYIHICMLSLEVDPPPIEEHLRNPPIRPSAPGAPNPARSPARRTRHWLNLLMGT